ncbi:hypothetical protein TDB9533_04606 [Thalassocella blandensis]|nr:hypothetical protein TDB9533_04606 [Thalassocella blandensis]
MPTPPLSSTQTQKIHEKSESSPNTDLSQTGKTAGELSRHDEKGKTLAEFRRYLAHTDKNRDEDDTVNGFLKNTFNTEKAKKITSESTDIESLKGEDGDLAETSGNNSTADKNDVNVTGASVWHHLQPESFSGNHSRDVRTAVNASVKMTNDKQNPLEKMPSVEHDNRAGEAFSSAGKGFTEKGEPVFSPSVVSSSSSEFITQDGRSKDIHIKELQAEFDDGVIVQQQTITLTTDSIFKAQLDKANISLDSKPVVSAMVNQGEHAALYDMVKETIHAQLSVKSMADAKIDVVLQNNQLTINFDTLGGGSKFMDEGLLADLLTSLEKKYPNLAIQIQSTRDVNLADASAPSEHRQGQQSQQENEQDQSQDQYPLIEDISEEV